MQFTLSPVEVDDADILTRKCDFPAMRDNPLHLIMFPNSTWATEEEEIGWMIDGLRDTLRYWRAGFRKICLEDGTPVGFAGWTLDQPAGGKSATTSDGFEDEAKKQHRARKGVCSPLPHTLDVESWRQVSKLFRDEKKRVLSNRNDIWRLNLIAVSPEYQRQGIGSMLLQWGCDTADYHSHDAFLIASPAGVQLYLKFGFEAVGEIRTSKGTFTSMFRAAQPWSGTHLFRYN